MAVSVITIVTGSGPQSNVMIPPSATASTTACDVQLAGVPLPITRSGCDVSTGRASAGSGTPPGFPAMGSDSRRARTLAVAEPSIRSTAALAAAASTDAPAPGAVPRSAMTIEPTRHSATSAPTAVVRTLTASVSPTHVAVTPRPGQLVKRPSVDRADRHRVACCGPDCTSAIGKRRRARMIRSVEGGLAWAQAPSWVCGDGEKDGASIVIRGVGIVGTGVVFSEHATVLSAAESTASARRHRRGGPPSTASRDGHGVCAIRDRRLQKVVGSPRGRRRRRLHTALSPRGGGGSGVGGG